MFRPAAAARRAARFALGGDFAALSETARVRRDPCAAGGRLPAAGVLAFAFSQTRNWRIGLGFTIGLGLAFARWH